MLVVKLELHPGGNPAQSKEIGKLNIANISDLAAISDYAYQIWLNGESVATGIVGSHERRKGAWLLVARALYNAAIELEEFGIGPG